MRFIRINTIFFTVNAIGMFLFSVTALPCDVPVFRYALERWPADPYEVYVFYDGKLSPDESKNVNDLEMFSAEYIPHSNYTVQTVDIYTSDSAEIWSIWDSLENPELPCLILRYPEETGIRYNVWHGRLSTDIVRVLIDSPVRQEIVKKILDGDAAVWILLESGNREKDDAAEETLRSQLKIMETTIKLPVQEDYLAEGEGDQTDRQQRERVSFSLIRLSRTDPQERLFIEMLIESEADLFEYESSPLAFPVYGRGRVLYALVGDGINDRTIQTACEFMTVACSCEVKAENPGVDLLIKADWDAGIGESWISDIDLPPLVGLSELLAAVSTDDSSDTGLISSEGAAQTAVDIETQADLESPGAVDDKSDNKPSRNNGSTLMLVGVIILFITSIRLWLGHRKSGAGR